MTRKCIRTRNTPSSSRCCWPRESFWASFSGCCVGAAAGAVHGPQQHHFGDQGHAPPDGTAHQQVNLYAFADRESICRFGGDGFACRARHPAAGQGARSPLGLYSGIGDAGDQRTARRRIRRHRRGLQHGDRHGDRAERHPAGPKRQGRDQGRRPYHRDQRHARRGAENPAARCGEEIARPARHDRAPRAGTPGYLRPGGRRRRARQDSDQECRIGVPHCRRHRLHQAGTVRPDDLR